MPKISVLMGVYNCESTVAKSIDSIVSQTFSDWELIVCDDGSSDATFHIITRYAQKEPRIIILKNSTNQGLSYTLNKCLSIARGYYCARMDGDDLCDPTRLEKQSLFLDEHQEYGFVSSLMKRFDESGIYDVPVKVDSYSPSKMDYVKGSPFCHAPVMIRRSAYEAVGGYRDLPNTLGVEDYDLWFRLYAVGIKGYVLHEPLYSMFDGRDAARRRTFKRRLNEAWVRKEGYRAMGIPWLLRIYILKPIVIGLLPQFIYRLLR